MKKVIAIAAIALSLVNCTETDLIDETGKLTVTDINLPELPNGYFYEGWLLYNGTFVSVGKINNDSINQNLARFSKIEARDLANAQSFAITVENNSSPAPSNFVLLVGDFNGNTSTLSPTFTSLQGIETLAQKLNAAYTVQNATVSAEDQNLFQENGIWFFKQTGSERQSTIKLYYNDIQYQAWLHNQNRYVNMGIIKSDSLVDDSNRYTTYTNIPLFSGEDFIAAPENETFPAGFFPVDVKGKKLIITPILPGYANNTEPFPIHLLQAEIPTNITKNSEITYEFQKNTNYSAKATKL